MYPTCEGRSSGLIGTNAPPAAETPNTDSTVSEPLLEKHRDAIAFLETESGEPTGHLPRTAPELGVGAGDVLEGDRRRVAYRPCSILEEVVEGRSHRR